MTQQPSQNDNGYRAYGELSHFVYCLLQKIKARGSLPVVEKWESYMLPNHSAFPAIEDQHFLVGTRVHAALEKMTSQYLKKEFRSSVRRFLDGPHQHRFIYCRCSFEAGSGRELLLPRYNNRGRWPFRLLSLWTAPGRLGWVWVEERVDGWSLQSWVLILREWPAPTWVSCQ